MSWFHREKVRPEIDPLSYLVVPQETAVLQRSGSLYHIQWQPKAAQVRLFVQTFSGEKQFVKQVAGVQETTVTGWETAVHPIFELHFEGGAADGQVVYVAERFLPLDGTVNFRDVGGYGTENGRFVRWGQLYRGGILANLTDADQELLQAIGLRTVCDVRSAEETVRRPDRLDRLNDLTHLQLSVETVDHFSVLRTLWVVLFQRHRLFDVLQNGYLQVVLEQNAHVVREIFYRFADPAHLPGLVHCTAGKDRTGIMVALILSVLGVPRETIVADYTLSNHFYDYFRESLKPDVQKLTRFGITIDDLWPFLVVDGATLTHTLETLDQRYGSVQTYLTERVGVETAVLDRLRANLLYDDNEC